MKSVLISIQPKWCELIANGEKTVEVRKTKPKLETPFKCYIYCTNGKEKLWVLRESERDFNREKIASIFQAKDVGGAYQGNGKIIGEFVCDHIDYWNHHIHDDDTITLERASELSFVSEDDLIQYTDLGHFYAWHISDLVIYEKPKELWEFAKPDKCPYNSPIGCTYGGHCYRAGQTKRCGDYVERPPQSWCYVEEGGE